MISRLSRRMAAALRATDAPVRAVSATAEHCFGARFVGPRPWFVGRYRGGCDDETNGNNGNDAENSV